MPGTGTGTSGHSQGRLRGAEAAPDALTLCAIHLGYRNVLWYRGGLEAWQRSGQQVVAAAR